MALVDLILTANSSTVSDDSGPWRQYILDHLDWITNNTGTDAAFTVSPVVMHQFKYDLKRFLKEQMMRNEDIAWIVLLLNNMGSDFEFDQPGNYIIPTDRLILQLYTSFKTISSNAS